MIDPVKRDALSELINIGFGRAANALSILVKTRIILKAPEAQIYSLEELPEAFNVFQGKEISIIYQAFGGSITGNMALLLDTDSAVALVDLIGKERFERRPLSQADRDDLMEIGNILLNAFCGSFGNLLNLSVMFSVPELYLSPVDKLSDVLTINHPEIQYAVVVKVHFQLSEGSVDGYVIILMGLASMESLYRAMETEGYLIGD